MLLTRPAPSPATETESPSLFSTLAFGALLALLLLAPAQLSGFWVTTYDFWPQALWLLLSAGVTFLLALSPEARPRFDAVSGLLLAFLSWCAVSLVGAVYRHDAWLEWARLAGALTPFFLIRALWSDKRGVWMVGAWVLGMTWVCFPALLNFAETRYPRQAGPFFHTNLFANALAMTLPMALVFPSLVARSSSNRAVRALSLAPFAICGLGLIVTSSKGGFAAALIGVSVAALAVWRAKPLQIRDFARRNRAVLTGAGLIFVLVFGAVGAKTILPRLQSARGADNNSTMFRAYVWRSTLDIARARPVLGFGPASFPHVYPRFAQVSYTRSAHQSWLQIAAENGAPALLLLLGAVGLALKIGLGRLKTSYWPYVAGAAGAVAAILVHGSVDAGLQTTSILILLSSALAFLTASETTPAPAQSRLSPAWIGATLLLAWGGNLTQKAASAQILTAEADQLIRKGASILAVPKAREATNLDPTSARAWSILGRAQAGSGEDGRAALQTAAGLQPTRGINWSNLARAAIQGGDVAQAEQFYARALEQDPRDTHLRLDRARFRLDSKNSAGYADLEAIWKLKTQPYGLYEPVESNVNLDYARATVLLAPELKRRRENARLQALVKSGLADCARARRFVASNEQMRRETGLETGDDADLEPLAAALQALQTALR